MNRRCLYCSWKCSCSPAGCSQANFNQSGSTDHVPKIREHRHQLLTYSPWWACTAWAEIPVLLLLLCCCYSTRSAVHPSHCSVDTASAARVKSACSSFWSELQEAPSFPLVGAPLPVMWNTSPQTWAAGRCGADALRGSGSDGLSSRGWDLFLVVTWHKRKRCVKLLLSFSFVPIREWILSVFSLHFKAKYLILLGWRKNPDQSVETWH